MLEAFQRRTEVEGLRDLAMTLIQAERFGTPLAQSMKNIAAQERTQRSARIEAQAERLPVLMTLPMILFVVPGTMCLVAGPAFLGAIRRSAGSEEDDVPSSGHRAFPVPRPPRTRRRTPPQGAIP